MVKAMFCVLSLCLILSCQQEGEVIQSKNSQSQDAQEESTSKKNPSNSAETPTNNFYDISGKKPDQICGKEGFEYLWKGFFLPECGGCHYEENTFQVTEFAQRGDLDSSFSVMTTGVDLVVFLESVQENKLCKTCNLEENDPLLADIKVYLKNPRVCP